MCPERLSTILDFPDCSCHRAFNSSLPMLVGHRDPRSSFLEPQLSDHQPRAPTCDSGTLFPLWLPATMTAPPPRTEVRLFAHIYSPNVWWETDVQVLVREMIEQERLGCSGVGRGT